MIRRIAVEVITIIIVFSPIIFLTEQIGLKPIRLDGMPLVAMTITYIVVRISQILLKQHRDRNEDIDNERRNRRNIY